MWRHLHDWLSEPVDPVSIWLTFVVVFMCTLAVALWLGEVLWQ